MWLFLLTMTLYLCKATFFLANMTVSVQSDFISCNYDSFHSDFISQNYDVLQFDFISHKYDIISCNVTLFLVIVNFLFCKVTLYFIAIILYRKVSLFISQWIFLLIMAFYCKLPWDFISHNYDIISHNVTSFLIIDINSNVTLFLLTMTSYLCKVTLFLKIMKYLAMLFYFS